VSAGLLWTIEQINDEVIVVLTRKGRAVTKQDIKLLERAIRRSPLISREVDGQQVAYKAADGDPLDTVWIPGWCAWAAQQLMLRKGKSKLRLSTHDTSNIPEEGTGVSAANTALYFYDNLSMYDRAARDWVMLSS
jgi:hypothetical protein